MNLRTQLLCLFLVMQVVTSKISAQVTFSDQTNVSDLFLTECGLSDTMTVRLTATSAQTNISVAAVVPGQFVFVNWLSQAGTSISGATITVASIPATTSVDLKFLVRAKCGANSAATSYKVNYTISGYSGGIVPSATPQGLDYISGTKAPVLSISNVGSLPGNNNNTATLGSSYTRKYKFFNTGSQSQIDTLYFKEIMQQGLSFVSMKVDGVSVTPTVHSGGGRDTVTYTIIKKIGNLSTNPGDTVIVEEVYQVASCPPGGSSSSVNGYWGCLSSPVCQQAGTNPSTQVPTSVPNITFSNYRHGIGCYSTSDTMEVRITNTGGQVSGLQMQVSTGYPSAAYFIAPLVPGSTQLARLDTTKIWISANPTGPWTRVYASSASGLPGYSGSDTFLGGTGGYFPNGSLWRRNVTIGNMAASSTLYLRSVVENRCAQPEYCGDLYHEFNYAANWKNNCGNTNYSQTMINGFSETTHAASASGDVSPPDLYDGDTATLSWTMSSQNSTYQHDTSIYYLEVSYPAGFTLANDTSYRTLHQLTNAVTLRADSIVNNTTAKTVRYYFHTFGGHSINLLNFILKARFKMSCAGGPPNPAPFTLTGYTLSTLAKSCTNYSCKILLVCSSTINVTPHCGICFRGGLQPRKLLLQRTTLGLPDNNQDGKPDPTGSLDMNNIELNKVAPRDTFKTIYRGKILTGSVPYPQTWAYAGAQSTFPMGNHTNFDVKGLYADVQVFDASAATSYTFTNVPLTASNSGNQRTLSADFSPSALTGYPSGFTFAQNDSIVVTTYFIFNTNNIGTTGGDRADLIQTKYWVSPLPAASITNDTMRYRCDDLSAVMKQVVAYYTISSPPQTLSGCGSTLIRWNHYMSIGNCCANYNASIHFPLEYRNFGIEDSFRVTIPNGFAMDSFNITFSHTTQVGNAYNQTAYSMTPSAVSGSTYTFNIKALYTPYGGKIIPSKGGFVNFINLYLKPTCSAPTGIPKTVPVVAGFTGLGAWAYKNNSLNGVGPVTDNQVTITYNGPSLDLANYGPTNALGKQKAVSWDLSVKNTAIASSMPNTWVGFKSISGGIVIDSLEAINASNVVISGTNITSSGGIYQLGNIASAGGTSYFRAYGHFTTCKRDSLIVYSSWNCTPPGYPANLASRPCLGDSTKIYLDTVPNTVQTDWFSLPSNPTTMCSPVTFEVDLSERVDARAYRPYLEVLLPAGGAGASISNAQFKYPANSGTYKNITGVNMGGGVIRFYVGDSNTTLKNNGLAVYEPAENNNRVRLKFQMTTSCAWISGDAVRVRGDAYRPCGDLLPPDVEFHPVNISGAPTPKVGLFLITQPPTLNCGSTVTYTAAVRNLDPAATGSGDSISVVLASGAQFVTGSTAFQKNAWAQTQPKVTTINGNQTLTWGCSGIPAFDTSKWTFQVTSNSGKVTCTNQDSAVFNYTTGFSATCGGSSCNSKVLNGSKTVTSAVKKPNLDYITSTGTLTYTRDTNALHLTIPDTIRAAGLQFTNTGNDTARNTSISFWYDANGNNTIDVGETTIATTTLVNVAPGATYTWSQTIIASGHNMTPCNSNIKMKVSLNCNCDSTGQVASVPVTCVERNTPMAGLGNFVWLDDDKDGIQDAGELGVAGVTVTLLNAGGQVIGSAVTDAYGAYHFSNLAPGSYSVQFTPPANYDYTSQTTGTATGSDASTTTGKTPLITLAAGQTNNDVDCGLVPASTSKGSIGDYVWYDTDQDGIQDSGEPPLAGVTVTLYNASGAVVGTTVTDNQGHYNFADLPAGNYSVGFTPPAAMVASPQTTGTSTGSDISTTTFKTGTISLAAGQQRTDIDAGFYPQPSTKASLGNMVWNDLNNNGVQDAGEPGVDGVTVTLYNSGGTAIATTKTDAFGNYVFNNLTAGTYSVGFSGLPSGYSLVTANTGGTAGDSTDSDPNTGTGRTGTYTLAAGEHNMSVDAGLYKSGNNYTLGDKVFVDADKNGIQGTGETGLAGVMVVLFNNSGTALDTAYTDAFGNYLFTNLPAGTYKVQVQNLPSGYAITGKDLGGNDATDSDADPTGMTATVTLSSGNPNDRSLDIGLVVGNPNTQTSSLGDKVWNDLDGDGVQDATEPGRPGVKVYLYASNGTTILDSTTTDAAGQYIFTGLAAGDYYVGISLPTGWSPTPLSGTSDPALDNNGNTAVGNISKSGMITLPAGEDNLSIDFGINKSGVLVVGDHVFLDANHNGIDDGTSSEPGIAGISVTLLDGLGNVAGSTVTDANGNYLFVDVPAGSNYRVQFGNLPSGYLLTSQNTGGNDGVDNDANASSGNTDPFAITGAYVYTTNPASTQRSYDGGIYPSTVAGLSGTYWLDADNDGIQDNTEAGLAGMKVTVYDNSGNPVATTITDANGNYQFLNLAPGTYTVGFESAPGGYQYTTQSATGSNSSNNSDANATTGRTAAITLSAGDFKTDTDVGVKAIVPASLGNKIWFDANQDGVQDAGEAGVPGVVLQLLDGSGNVVATTVTDGNGNYLFGNLLPGSYAVKMASLPEGLMITRKDVGSDLTDNDFDKNTRKTPLVTLAAGENNSSLDGGLGPQGYGTLGSFVFNDLKVNGIADFDPGIGGVKIYLYDAGTNNIIDSAVTDANGAYLFDSLPKGNYKLKFANPAGMRPTYQNIRNNSRDSWDSDIDTISGFTAVVTMLTNRDTNMYVWAGFTTLTPLPVSWLFFHAKPEDHSALLDWKVAEENNCRDYYVWRRLSTDAEFRTIATVTGFGTVPKPVSYTYRDTQSELLQHTVYYQITQQDFNGHSTPSEIRAVQFPEGIGQSNFWYLPNPVATELTVYFTSENGYRYYFTDVTGRNVLEGFSATAQTTVNVSGLASGVYILTVKNEITGRSSKVVVAR